MTGNDVNFTAGTWAAYTIVTFLFLCVLFVSSKWRVIQREGLRAAFRAWDGPGHWFGITLLTAAFSSAGGLLLMHALRHFFA